MKITDLTVDLLRVPPTVRLQDAIQNITTWEWILVTLETDEGIRARGWTYTLGMGGAAIREMIDVYLRPLLLGADPQNVERLWHRCSSELHAIGAAGTTSLAVSAVDIALWDAIGQSVHLPLFRLFGGYRESIPVYASGLNLHLEGDGLAEQLEAFMTKGYRTVKVKVGRDDLEEDLERVAVARRTITSRRELLLDANQKWQAGDAVRRIRSLEQFAPAWVEEPIHADDFEGNRRVRASTGTPIASGESLYTRSQFGRYISGGAIDVVQADVARVGGFTEWLKIANLASAHHLQMAPHYMTELSVHALCGIHNGRILEDIEGGTLTELGLLAEPFAVHEGLAFPPARPGHGVIFDEAAVEKYTVDGPFDVTPTRRT